MNRTLPTTAAAVAIAALSLTACKKAELMAPPPAKPPPSASSDANAAMTRSSGSSTPAPADQATETLSSPQAPMLAMAYRLGLAVPAGLTHARACQDRSWPPATRSGARSASVVSS